jgi:hypothetical protein
MSGTAGSTMCKNRQVREEGLTERLVKVRPEHVLEGQRHLRRAGGVGMLPGEHLIVLARGERT